MRPVSTARTVAATVSATAAVLAGVPGVSAAIAAEQHSAPTPTISERALGLGGQSRGITGLADGSAWFAVQGNPGGIGRVSPAGRLQEMPGGIFTGLTAASDPTGVTPGPDGTVWFTEQAGEGAVGYVDATGSQAIEFEPATTSGFTAFGQPSDIALGADGNLWVTLPGTERIARVTPAGDFTEYPLVAGSRPTAIVPGPDGALWFTDTGAVDRFGRIATDGAISYFKGLPSDSQPADIATDADGNLWITLEADPGGIARVTTAGVVRVFTPANSDLRAGSRPSGIAAGADGHMWFAQSAAPGGIGRITLRGSVHQFVAGVHPGLSADTMPFGMTAHADGGVWFTATASSPRVGRVTVGPSAGKASAHGVSYDSAIFKAFVAPNGQDATYRFEYGTTTAFGSTTPVAPAGSAPGAQVRAHKVDGLRPEATYHFRVVASNATDTAYGPVETFKTSAAPPSEDTAGPAAERPKPALSRKVVVGKASGRIKVRMPDTAEYVELDTSRELPVGSHIDASEGRIRLTAALPGGRQQTGAFWGGKFRVRQSKTGLTEAVLSGKITCRAGGKQAVAAGARSKRRLWGKDRSGRFRTRGAHSVATVRGTEWLVEDRCGSTLTRVKHGAVVVRDAVRGKTVLVRSGKRYVARARR